MNVLRGNNKSMPFFQSLLATYEARVASNSGGIEAHDATASKLKLLNELGVVETASFLMLPEGLSQGYVYSQLPNIASGDLTFTRASAGSRYNSVGQLEKLLTNDYPAFDYLQNGVSNNPCLLLQPQRTNYYQYSEEPNNTAGWDKSGVTFPSSNAVTDVYGKSTDNLLLTIGVDGSAIRHRMTQHNPISVVNGNVYTMSVLAKKSANDWIQLCPVSGDYNSNDWANFNLNTGAVGSVGTGATAKIENWGNGWYRCILLCRCINTNANSYVDSVLPTNNTDSGRYPSYQSTEVTNCFYVMGFQFELGSFHTSPIYTSNASATRVASVFQVSNVYTNNIISSNGGTIYFEFANNIGFVRDASERIGIGDDTSFSTNFIGLLASTNGRLEVWKRIAGTLTSLYTTTTNSLKIAISFDGSIANVYVNGSRVVGGTSFAVTLANMQYLLNTGGGIPKNICAIAAWNYVQDDVFCNNLTT
jgi:hypothetical protein